MWRYIVIVKKLPRKSCFEIFWAYELHDIDHKKDQ